LPQASRSPSVLRFAWKDGKDAMWSALRVFAWTTGGLGLALFVAVLLNPRRAEPLTVANVIATLVGALVYAAVPGLIAAAGAALFRLAGMWAFVPLVVFPVVALGVYWLGRGALNAQGQDVWNALRAQMQAEPLTFSWLPVHGGTIEVLVVMLLLYGLFSALQPAVLWQLLQYLLLVAILIGVALLLTCVITLPPLFFAIGRRARARYADYIARSSQT
jgi:hypothetical protein